MKGLRVGDRVKVIFVPKLKGTKYDKIKVGMMGTVKDTTNFCFPGVEFDDNVSGYSGDWGGKDGHCWQISYDYLERIEENGRN